MDRERIIDIINITYSRIMQLHFNRRFISTMVSNGVIASDYPDLTWSLKSSFAADAYTTVSSLLSTGNYSFGRLGQEDSDIKSKVEQAEKEISNVIDDFRNIRNRMFCHAIDKKSFEAIDKIYCHFDSVFYILMDLHVYCCAKLGIKDNDFIHYDAKVFESLQNEITDFCDVLLKGHLEVSTKNFLESRRKDGN